MAAYEYACSGIITMDEVLRVSGQVEELDATAGESPDGEFYHEVEADVPVQIPGA
jgi:MSHA biogenesis protein MshE